MSKDNFLSSQENSDNDENNKDEFGSFKKGKTPDVQIPIITYSEGMKNVIN